MAFRLAWNQDLLENTRKKGVFQIFSKHPWKEGLCPLGRTPLSSWFSASFRQSFPPMRHKICQPTFSGFTNAGTEVELQDCLQNIPANCWSCLPACSKEAKEAGRRHISKIKAHCQFLYSLYCFEWWDPRLVKFAEIWVKGSSVKELGGGGSAENVLGMISQVSSTQHCKNKLS